MFTAESRFLLPPALIRMGDLLQEGHKDPFTAAQMYTKAALRNDPQVCYSCFSHVSTPHCLCLCARLNHLALPQGWYSLGLLVEEGFSLPLSILLELGLSELYLADRSLLLSTLYSRCVSHAALLVQNTVFNTEMSGRKRSQSP